MRITVRCICLLVSVLAITSTLVFAEERTKADEQSLFTVKSLKCEFHISVMAPKQWDDTPKIGKDAFSFHVDAINLHSGTARLIANLGSADLIVLPGTMCINFIKQTPTGNMNFITVYPELTKEGKFKAVYSRHITLLGIPMPSQRYGYCQRWE